MRPNNITQKLNTNNMDVTSMAGFSGLAKNQDRVAEAQRGIATLQNLDNGIQKDKQESMMLQELEAKQYEEINQKASELLERDRDKIKIKALDLQSNIRGKIKEYGSRKAFFESGGVALLSKYKGDLLTSKEVMQYKDNKDNMTQILAAQAAGKGGLLSTIDMQNLTSYQSGVGDKITYSGLKSEVDIPANAFDYGEAIAPVKILHNADNYMRIYGNFIKDHPDLKALTGQNLEDQLIEYTYQNYGQSQGTNQFKMQQEAAEKNYLRQRADAIAASTPAVTPEDNNVPIVTTANNFLNAADSDVPITVDNVSGVDSAGRQINYFEKLKGKNDSLNILLGGSQNYYKQSFDSPVPIGKFVGLDRMGYDIGRLFGKNPKYQPASAVNFLSGKKKILNRSLFETNEDGTINVSVNGEEFLNAKGEKLNEEEISDYGDNARKMNVLNYIIAFNDENGKLVTNVVNSKGEIIKDKEANDDHKKGYSGKLKHDLFAVIKDDKGHILYKRVDMNSIIGDSELSNALGAGNNIAPVLKESAQFSNQKKQAEANIKLNSEIVYNEVNKASTQSGAFGKPAFIAEARQMQLPDNSNRNSMLKAFYLAQSDMLTGGKMNAKNLSENGMIDSRKFSSLVNLHPELKNASIATNKYSDTAFIDLFAKVISKDGDENSHNPEDEAENAIFAQKWKQYYNLILKNK